MVAEIFATNVRGNSQVKSYCYSDLDGGGLRTLSGGQMMMQVDGPLGVQSNAVPEITCDAARSVRDVFARLNQPPTGGMVSIRILRNGQTYCELTIAAGQSTAQGPTDISMRPLESGDAIGLDITTVPQGAGTLPGSSLTVTIRF